MILMVHLGSLVSGVFCRLPAKATFLTSKFPRWPTAATQNGHSSRNKHGAQAKLRRTVCASMRRRNAHRHVTMTLSCENLQQKMPVAREHTLISLGVDTLFGEQHLQSIYSIYIYIDFAYRDSSIASLYRLPLRMHWVSFPTQEALEFHRKSAMPASKGNQ